MLSKSVTVTGTFTGPVLQTVKVPAVVTGPAVEKARLLRIKHPIRSVKIFFMAGGWFFHF
jgi:hypothetical protein